MVDPARDRLITDLNSTLGQHFFDVAQAQCEPEIQPDRMFDHVRRDSVALERPQSRSIDLQDHNSAKTEHILSAA